MQLKPRTYKYNGLGGLGFDDTETHIGVIAQEVEEVAPYMVETGKGIINGQEVDDFKSYQGHALSLILVNAIKEQQEQIETLQNSLDMEAVVDLKEELEDQMEEIKTMINEQGAASNIAINEEQIETNKQNIALIYQMLGIKNESGDIKILGKLEAGKIKTDTLEASETKTNKVIIGSDSEEALTLGSGIIKAGELQAVVKTTAAAISSKIFITLRNAKSIVPAQVGEIKENESFEVEIGESLDEDVNFDWWIIEKEE